MTSPIRPELISERYDQMIRHAPAIRVGTALTEASLRRFTRSASHASHHAMLELDREAGLPAGFRYHDLRHYFASLLIAHGADVKAVQARLRHGSGPGPPWIRTVTCGQTRTSLRKPSWMR